MVMFVCNACGESMRKAKVEEHYKFQCKNCDCVSCLDCGKDFWGEDYAGHLKCISEAEKYQGVATDYSGDQKQEAWVAKVADVISTYKGNPRVATLLRKSIDCPNLPRKQKKFINFAQSAFHESNLTVLNEAWGIIEKANMKVPESTEEPPAAAAESAESQGGLI